MKSKLSIILLPFFILSVSLRAQTTDHGIWSTVGIEKKLGKWNMGAESELRTKENCGTVDRWSLKLESSYNIFKSIQVGASYEYIYFHDTRYLDYQPRHRMYAFAQGKYRLGRFTFSMRERAQVTRKDDSDRIKSSGKINTYKINPAWILRNRIKVAYNIPKFPVTPSLSFESFYQLNNSDGNMFSKLRYELSFNYNLTKHHHFELYELLDKEIKVSSPVNRYITGVKYVYSL
jgi:hypothetical protein